MNSAKTYHAVLDSYTRQEDRNFFTKTGTGFDADYKNTRAAVYGNSEAEVKKQLDAWKSFPGCTPEFWKGKRTYFDSYPILQCYKGNTPNNRYIYKASIFNVMMQRLPFEGEDLTRQLIADVISIYFKFLEEVFNGVNELILFDEEPFDRLIERMNNAKKNRTNNLKDYKVDLPTIVKLIAQKLNKCCPRNNNSLLLSNLFADANTRLEITKSPDVYRKVVHISLVFLKVLHKFVHSSPKMFSLTRIEEVDASKHPKIRLFIHGNKRFFLGIEILREWELKRYPGKLWDFDESCKEDIHFTVGYERLDIIWNKCLKAGLETLDLIHYEIEGTKSRSVWIPGFRESYCLLASDTFLELLKHLISTIGLFQVVDERNWSKCDSIFRIGPKYNKRNVHAPFFTNVRHYSEANTRIVCGAEKIIRESLSETVQEVAPIGDNGFNLDGLEAEIRRLKINRAFPNIMEYTQIVYQRIQEGNGVLKTCDMYDALEQCQLLAFFKKYPVRYDWLKKHGAHHVPPFCYPGLLL